MLVKLKFSGNIFGWWPKINKPNSWYAMWFVSMSIFQSCEFQRRITNVLLLAFLARWKLFLGVANEGISVLKWFFISTELSDYATWKRRFIVPSSLLKSLQSAFGRVWPDWFFCPAPFCGGQNRLSHRPCAVICFNKLDCDWKWTVERQGQSASNQIILQ